MKKSGFKRGLLKACSVLSAAAMLLAAVPMQFTADAFEYSAAASSAAASQVFVHNDTLDMDITDNAYVYLDNSEISDGKKSAVITVSLADSSGSTSGLTGEKLLYDVEDSSGSLVVTDLSKAGDDSRVTLRLDAFKIEDGQEVPLDPGTVSIAFTNSSNTVSKMVRCTVFNPATDMKIYWNGQTEPLPLNDLCPTNSTTLTAVSGHTYTLAAALVPDNSTDRVAWRVSDGVYTGAAGTSITSTNKATVTEDGRFTALEEGTVTIVGYFPSSYSSPRMRVYGMKEVYKNGESGETETIRTRTVPKYIIVNIVKANPVDSVSLVNAPSYLEEGRSWKIQSVITARGEGEPTDEMKWVSSNESVITVDQDGTINAVGIGIATVSLYAEDKNIFAEQTIRVYKKAKEIVVTPSDPKTRVSVPIELTAELTPSDADDEIVWKSSDESVAAVAAKITSSSRQTAVVTGVSEGTVSITATALNSGIAKTVTVTVEPKVESDNLKVSYDNNGEDTRIVDNSTLELYTGKSLKLNAELTALDGSPSDDTVEWTFSNNTNGYLTETDRTDSSITLFGSAEGVVIVKAYAKSDPTIYREFYISVLRSCDEIKFYDEYGNEYRAVKYINVGTLLTIRPELIRYTNNPSDHSDMIVSWESSDPEIATVDDYGNIRGIKNGLSRITAYSASGVTKVIEIVVYTTSQVTIENLTPSDNGGLPYTHIDMIGGAEATIFLEVDVKDQLGNSVEYPIVELSSSDESVCVIKPGNYITGITTGQVTITAKSGAWSDQCTVYVHANIKDAEIENVGPQTYMPTKYSYEPRPAVRLAGKKLIEGLDYSIRYENNMGIGSASMTITGMGYIDQSRTIDFNIEKKPLTDTDIHINPPARMQGTGEALTPRPEISCSGVFLTPDVDFTVTYSDNIYPGTATMLLRGKGNYDGELTIPFEIYCDHADTTEHIVTREASCDKPGIISYKCNICGQNVEEEIPTIDHTFTERVVDPTANDKGYTLHTCSVCGYSYKDSYTDTIEGTDILECTATISGDTFAYTGQPITPAVTLRHNGVLLKENTDFTVLYLSNTEVGTGYAVILGMGNYVGTGKISFTITNSDVVPSQSDTDKVAELIMTDPEEEADPNRISLSQNDIIMLDPYVYSPAIVPIEPRPVVSLKGNALIENVDYTLAYANNSDVGTATIVMKGIGKYKGIARFQFDILPKPLTDAEVTVRAIAPQVCTGKALTPATIVLCDGIVLANRRDYKVTYENNIEPGVAKAVITGITNFTGTLNVTFEIDCDHDYDVQVVAPTHSARGYTLHTCKICGASYKDNYTDQLVTNDLSECEIEIPAAMPYTGKPVVPPVKITCNGKTLVEGTDYTVSCGNNTNTGLADVTVRGIGGFTGIVKRTFQITEGIKGDVNSDGVITADDALMALRATVGLINLTDSQNDLAEVTGDGEVTTEDSLSILRYTVGFTDPKNIIGTASGVRNQ